MKLSSTVREVSFSLSETRLLKSSMSLDFLVAAFQELCMRAGGGTGYGVREPGG